MTGSMAAPESLYLSGKALQEARVQGEHVPSWDLRPWQVAELELLLSGALAPLRGYPDELDFDALVRTGATRDGTVLGWPLGLDVDLEFAGTLQEGATIGLRDPEGLLIALMDVTDIWQPDSRLLQDRLGSQSPAVARWLQDDCLPLRLAGSLRGIAAPCHYDFIGLRAGPTELRPHLQRRGWQRILAVMTGQPVGPGDAALIHSRARELEASVLLLPDGIAEVPGDSRYYARLRALEQSLHRFPDQTTMTALVPLRAHRGSAAETALRERIACNYGATHVMHLDAGQPAAAPAQSRAIGVTPVPRATLCYLPDRDRYCLADKVPRGEVALPACARDLLERLQEGEAVPTWLGWPEQIAALRHAFPPRLEQGVTLFLTGLPGAGKSTLARALTGKLMERGTRRVTLLDGHRARGQLAGELGFSRADRNINVQRLGFVATEISRNGGIAVCAPIAPYEQARRQVRSQVEAVGGFVEVHVATPLEVCEQRDRRGLYARARAGLLDDFTGISAPYEPPSAPELRIDTSATTPDQAAQQVLLKLQALGYL